MDVLTDKANDIAGNLVGLAGKQAYPGIKLGYLAEIKKDHFYE